jgi:hypothetical protein
MRQCEHIVCCRHNFLINIERTLCYFLMFYSFDTKYEDFVAPFYFLEPANLKKEKKLIVSRII